MGGVEGVGGRREGKGHSWSQGRKEKINLVFPGSTGMFGQSRRLRQLQALAAKKFPNPEVS